MQTLDIISVNIWNTVISLCNLLIIFLVVKKFLFKPIKKVLDSRREKIDSDYAEAKKAVEDANAARTEYEQKLERAHGTAEDIIKDATAGANRRADDIVQEAKQKAAVIIKRAEEDAELEMKKARGEIRHEIADVSVQISEKLLEREINEDDHRGLIDSFIENLGEPDDENL